MQRYLFNQKNEESMENRNSNAQVSFLINTQRVINGEKPKNESKEFVGNISMQAGEIKALTKKIVADIETIIAKEISRKQVVEEWNSLKTQIELFVYSKQIVPDYYIDIVSYISKNYSKLNSDVIDLCDQTLLDCTNIALSHLSTLAKDTSKYAYKVSVQRAKLLLAIQNFQEILKTFNLNFMEELKKEEEIIENHLKPSSENIASRSIAELSAANVLEQIKAITKTESAVTQTVANELDERTRKILQALDLDSDKYETFSPDTIKQLEEIVNKHLVQKSVMLTRVTP